MSTSTWVALVVMAVLGLWLLGARQRLKRLRTEAIRAFGKLHDDLTRRHRRIADLVARTGELSSLRDTATPIAPNDSPAAPLIGQTLEAARQASDLAKAAPMVAARITAVDRAEVALGLRLADSSPPSAPRRPTTTRPCSACAASSIATRRRSTTQPRPSTRPH